MQVNEHFKEVIQFDRFWYDHRELAFLDRAESEFKDYFMKSEDKQGTSETR